MCVSVCVGVCGKAVHHQKQKIKINKKIYANFDVKQLQYVYMYMQYSSGKLCGVFYSVRGNLKQTNINMKQ